MKSLITLLQCVLHEWGTRCGTSTHFDLKKIEARCEHEGISFLTISLSNFGKDFEKSLDQGYVGHDQFVGFRRSGGLPLFLGGFLDLVFDRLGGRLLDNPSIDAIKAVRQITLMFAKINLPCSKEREEAAIDRYIECEEDVRRYDKTLQDLSANGRETNAELFGRVSRLIFSRMLTAVDQSVYYESILPKHGPGATADGLRGNSKYRLSVWTSRLENVFPYWEHLLPSERFLPEFWDRNRVTFLDPGTEIPAKVVLVPKTLKTPRVIAMEPSYMQYLQQGLLELITHEISRDDFASAFIKSDSQEPNQWLARIGSRKGTLATLDLSEASDRVSNQHVRLLLANHPHLSEAVDATRSRKADVPCKDGKKTIRLAKFASMGSALCFPFEAMVFLTVVFVGIEQQLNRPLAKKDVESFYGLVRVYGDDIIVPVDYVQSVLQALETFGFRVNVHKSFWTGKFRESCGKDYYDGHDVSVVRVRSMFPGSRKHVSELQSTVSLRNQLFHAGYTEAVDWLDDRIKKLIPFPIVESTSTLLGRHSHGPCEPEGYDYDLHLPLVRGVTVVSELPDSTLDGPEALLKYFLKRGVEPFADKEHLKRAGRPVSARIKNRWSPPF